MRKKLFRFAVILVVGIVYSLFIGCPLFKLFNIRCPFCGMTRAHIALFTKGLNDALAQHNLFFLGIPILLSIFTLDFTKKHKHVYIATIIFLIIAFTAIFIHYFFT
ncbi:MAG: DUF2752 domain-containing protein [Clostridia bacterium]|nr:DUF2752 domain-containing protein [Clostridia bacterium]